MLPLLADAGGPFLLVFAGGVLVAAVLAVVGVVLLGLYVARRMTGKPPTDPGVPPE